MSRMTLLADAIVNSSVQVPRNVSLPYPNIYFASVYAIGRAGVHTYLCADHTRAAVQKTANWCAEFHKFRPVRSNSCIKLRRLMLEDLIENPAAYDKALQLAIHNGERDNVAKLEALPEWIAQRCGVPMIGEAQVKTLWQQAGEALRRIEEGFQQRA